MPWKIGVVISPFLTSSQIWLPLLKIAKKKYYHLQNEGDDEDREKSQKIKGWQEEKKLSLLCSQWYAYKEKYRKKENWLWMRSINTAMSLLDLYY